MNFKPAATAPTPTEAPTRRHAGLLAAVMASSAGTALAQVDAGTSQPLPAVLLLAIGALAGLGIHGLALWATHRKRESASAQLWQGLGSCVGALVLAVLSSLLAPGATALVTVLGLALAVVSLAYSVNTQRRISRLRQQQVLDMEVEIAGVASRMDELQRQELEMEFRLSQRETDLQNSQMLMRDMDYHDALTGQPNQRLLADRFAQTVARSKRDKGRFALLTVNIDNFRRVNEKRGRHVGDALLQATAKRLGAALRTSDTLARLHADEFVVLLNDTNEPDAIGSACRKVLDAMHGDIECKGLTVRATVSIGAAQYGADGESLDDLVRTAKQAMRRAKNEGGDRFRLVEAAPPAAAQPGETIR